MNHLLRLAWLLLTSWARTASPDMTRPTRLRMIVWPTDLDPLLHMNNGVYLSLMDLGRIDLMLKTRTFHKIRKAGIYPVIVSEAIRFRKSLRLFTRFEIVTHLVSRDDKYFYLSQHFVVRGQLYAAGLVKGRFLHKSGRKVAPEEMLKLMSLEPGELPEIKSVRLLKELDEALGSENASQSHK